MSPQINYQVLSGMNDIEVGGQEFDMSSVSASLKSLTKLPAVDKFLFIIIIVAAIVATIYLGPFCLLIALFIPVILLTRRLGEQQAEVWKEFAAANGWKVIPANSVDGLVPITVATAGHSHKSSDAVSGQFSHGTFYIFKHQYTIGEGKNSTTYALTIVALTLNVNLPHMLLRAPHSINTGNTGELKEKLQLEGDFNKYFKVFAEPNDEVDELTILTPDVMQFLIQNDSVIPTYNIETYQGGIYSIGDGELRKVTDLPKLVDFSFHLYAQVLQNLPMAQFAPDPSKSAPAAN